MRVLKHTLFISPTSLLLALLFAPQVQAETIDCVIITSLPYTISSSGVYCLTGNLGTAISTGNAITIDSNNVTIDLNGWRLGGLAAGDSTNTIGIYATQRKNITIRNGTIRGFKRAIFLQDFIPHTTSQGHLVEDIRAEQNTTSGIEVYGQGSITRRNQVVATGRPTVTNAYGISVTGPGCRVLDNDITETRSGIGQAAGVVMKYADGGMIRNNRISGVSSGNDTGSWGVIVDNSDRVVVRGNDISDPGDLGLTITLGTGGIYMDNLVSGATTNAYSGTATAAGSTNYSD